MPSVQTLDKCSGCCWWKRWYFGGRGSTRSRCQRPHALTVLCHGITSRLDDETINAAVFFSKCIILPSTLLRVSNLNPFFATNMTVTFLLRKRRQGCHVSSSLMWYPRCQHMFDHTLNTAGLGLRNDGKIMQKTSVSSATTDTLVSASWPMKQACWIVQMYACSRLEFSCKGLLRSWQDNRPVQHCWGRRCHLVFVHVARVSTALNHWLTSMTSGWAYVLLKTS